MDICDCVLLPEMLGTAFLQTFTALFLNTTTLNKNKGKTISIHAWTSP